MNISKVRLEYLLGTDAYLIKSIGYDAESKSSKLRFESDKIRSSNLWSESDFIRTSETEELIKSESKNLGHKYISVNKKTNSKYNLIIKGKFSNRKIHKAIMDLNFFDF